MCFSAEASFIAAVLLGTIGSVTLKNSTSRADFFLASIPFLFAIQQFAEGIVWLNLKGQVFTPGIAQAAKEAFLTFAFLIWPIWVPLALTMAEKVAWRKNIILADLVCGILLSLLNLYYALGQEISVKIVNQSLQYIGNAPSQIFVYPFIVLFPCFISSLKNMWIFGTLVAVAYVIAEFSFSQSFVSVWCFFAAIVSLSVYKVLNDNKGYFSTKNELGA